MTGLILAPVGWIMFGINRSGRVLYDPKPDVSVAVTPTRDGATIGLAGSF